jgi:Tol biopolymer transport system component
MRWLAPLVLVALALGVAATARGGAPRPASFSNPAWSPDGTRIAWADASFGGSGNPDAELWTASADGSGASPLVKGLANGLFQVVWPQPDALLYDANFRVVRATVGGQLHVVLPDTGSTFAADARGDRVASSCDRCYGPITVAAVGSGKRVQLGGKGVAGGGATLSPNGSLIAFNRLTIKDARAGDWKSTGLWVARTNGTSYRRLDPRGTCASWSPAGDSIAYMTLEKSSLALRTIAPDGSHRRLLLLHGPVCSVPSSVEWSPDGKQIAYIDARKSNLVLLDVASLHTTTVTAFPSVTGMAWSPDGTRLLVTARPQQTACSSLWTVAANGTGAALLRQCPTA